MARSDLALILEALQFSAEKHRRQRRKDVEASPYINHPIQVTNLLAQVGGVEDVVTLVAAVLHDTIEDTETTPEEIEGRFGREVRIVVEEVTDDKSLPKAERKRLQIERAPHASPRAKQIKIADKICNVLDITHRPPATWPAVRRREYLDWTERVVAGCRGANPVLERRYEIVLREARAELARPG